jgi:hypothetical protein
MHSTYNIKIIRVLNIYFVVMYIFTFLLIEYNIIKKKNI